tara:strand:+ start:58 stop:231 length:174 start_codon:yes stop_codon:yes gene_type:complete
MAKSFKQQKTRENYSKDVLKKMSKKERRFNKELASQYVDDEVDELEEEEYEYDIFRK